MMALAIERQRIPRIVAIRKELISWERLAQVVLVIGFLTTWEIAGRRLGDFFLAPPSSLVSAFEEMLASGEYVAAVLDSMASLLVGFGLAAAIGISVGFLMGWYRPIGKILNPFVSALYVVPIAALVPVLIIWFGLGFTPRVMSVLLFSVFEILVSTYTGVKNVDPMLVDVASSFGAKRLELFRKVVFFASLPYIFAGLRMGAARAIKGMIVAELLFAVTGIGGAIQTAANYYRTDKVFVYVITLAVLGIALSGAIQIAERLSAPWKQQRSS
jgi:ABC-type nitrate/sulfonate/bicarbonate transport system permease component